MTGRSNGTFKFKNLLILTPTYPNEDDTDIRGIFIKKQLDCLKLYFENVYVIAPIFNCFKKSLSDKRCTDYEYDNVKVYYPKCFYVPIFYFSKFLIDNRLYVVKNLIEKESLEFDLIHSHFTWPSGHIGVKLKEIYSVPVVITIHENGEWFDKEVNMNHSLINHSWKMADALIRVNNKDVPTLKRYNQNVFSIPNGFGEEFKVLDSNFCKKQLNLPKDKKIIFSLGALIDRKGFNYLIDSMKIIIENRNDCVCYIGGSGKLKDKLQSQINDLELEKYVKLIGFIPDEMIPLWMNACDFFVLPSLNEGNPTVMFECLGCGKPFVGTKVGGVPEIINSEDYGLLCNPAKPKDLAMNILSALYRDWDSNLIKKYSAQFSWDKISNQTLQIYSQVLANNVN
jgi:teichuronic acid biosynthesis glycosyltransferase TuaC